MLRFAHFLSLPRIHVLFRPPAFRRAAVSLRRRAVRAFSLLLCLSLLATSTPAAPPVLKEMASGAWLGAALWLDSSGWSLALREVATGQLRPAAADEEQQEERDARVARVEVSPGAR